MEIRSGLNLKDCDSLVHDISIMHFDEGTIVPVEVELPEYVDAKALLAMERRMVETSRATGYKLRLVGQTENPEVEKYVTRMFADRDDIYTTIDWRNTNE